ncbi:MAG TPA: ATP phosphoribosyltransferase regulatory subunit [Methyloceanibacter sp.]|nr:ATP phosphoribosyltransferase regulatory subunit [Methyloceanibacter sp.]
MAAESAKEFEALEAQAASLLDLFRLAGYEQVAPSIIQPADIFLDQIGEQLRSRTYVFTDLAGEELCLRPDLTVPVSRLYLERHPKADRPARYCYNGPAVRVQLHAPRTYREFRQAGIECFGESDQLAADVEIMLLAVEAVRRAGLEAFRLRFGDIALFYALLDALALPERWRLKLRHYFWRPQAFHALLARLARGESSDGKGAAAPLVREIAGLPPEQAEERVAAYLDAQGLPLSGNRSLSEITARLVDHAADLGAAPLPREVATVIDAYLDVGAPPKEAADRIALIAKGAGIDLGPALDALNRRFARLEAAGVALDNAIFAAEFGRNLEYYSGLVFQIEALGGEEAIAGGGRYDGLLGFLGAPRAVPAIGCAIHTERLLAAVRRPA